jgi:hypothetical protein
MLGDDLRTVVSGALHRVKRDIESVRYPGVPLPGHDKRVSVIAEPLRDSHGALTHVLISLADADAQAAPVLVPPFADVPGARLEGDTPPEIATISGLTREQIRALEEELSYTKERLQAAIQEHETANEEL